MVSSYIASAGRRAGFKGAATATAMALGLAWSGHAAAQADALSLQYMGGPAFASLSGLAEGSIALLGGEADAEDCEAQAPEAGGDTLLALASLEPKSSRGPRKLGPGQAPAAVATPPAPAAMPAPAAPPASPVAADTARDWEIMVADKTLNATMARWAAAAGWQLLWELPVDYAVEARTQVRGTFEEAVGTVARSMESAEIPMKAVFYQGNKVLRIMAKGSE